MTLKPYIENGKVWLLLGLEYGKICILDMETGEIKDYKEVNEQGKFVIDILLPNKDTAIVVYRNQICSIQKFMNEPEYFEETNHFKSRQTHTAACVSKDAYDCNVLCISLITGSIELYNIDNEFKHFGSIQVHINFSLHFMHPYTDGQLNGFTRGLITFSNDGRIYIWEWKESKTGFKLDKKEDGGALQWNPFSNLDKWN